MASTIEEIKSNVDIVDYIGKFVDLTAKGQNFVGLCPFHQDNDPSFKVSPSKNIFKCFGCGKGGNIFNFVTLYHKVDFGEAIRILSDELGIEEDTEYDEYYKQMAVWHAYFRKGHTEFALDYLKARDISFETSEHFEVGFIPDAGVTMDSIVTSEEIMMKLGVIYKPKYENNIHTMRTKVFRFKFPGCLTFPFFDDRDRVVGFSFMRIHRRDDEPKYENSWTTPIFKRRELLFGLKQNLSKIKGTGCVYLVEGYFDAMRLRVEKFDRGVAAICGSTMTDEQVTKINRYCHRVEINFDGDEAGREGAVKSAFKCEEAGLETYIADYPDGSDPDDHYFKHPQLQGVIKTFTVPEFFDKYNKNADDVDVLLAHASKIKNLDVVENYIKVVKDGYPNIPVSLIAARMSQIHVISEKYKMKPSEFSIQKELIKAMLQGLMSPDIFDDNKFSNELRPKVLLLKVNKKEHKFINLDSSIMSQFTEFLEPLNVAVEELPKLALPYREYKDINELIKAKKELHN